MVPSTFAWYDYLMFAGVLALSLLIGIVFAFTGGRQRTTNEYLTADRSLGILPVTLSMYMSFTSGIAILGNAAEMYTFGVQMWLVTVGNAIAYIIGAWLFLPLFYKLQLTSSFEYFELRYKSKAVRKLGSSLSIIGSVLYSGLALYSPATSLEAVTPIPYWATIVGMGVIGTVYTTFGGIKAVVWTDAFQGVAMFVGVLVVCILGVQEVGTISDVWNIDKELGRLWVTFDPDPFIRLSFWSTFVGSIVTGINTVGTSQPSVQRYVAMRSMKKAFIAALLCIPLHMMFYTMTFVTGGAMLAYYHLVGCDPYRSGQVSNSNQLFTYFVLNGLQRPAFPGLITAVLICGALSSFSSSTNSNAAITWKDFLEGRGPFRKITETGRTWTNKILSLIYGSLSIAMAFGYTTFTGNAMMVSRSISRAGGSPILGMFILGGFFPFTNKIGVMVGACVGFAMHMTVGLGNSIYDPWPKTLNTTVDQCPSNYTIKDDFLVGNEDTPTFFQMSFLWHDPWGTVVTVVVGLIVSLLTGPLKLSGKDRRYLIPVFDRLFSCCHVSDVPGEENDHKAEPEDESDQLPFGKTRPFRTVTEMECKHTHSDTMSSGSVNHGKYNLGFTLDLSCSDCNPAVNEQLPHIVHTGGKGTEITRL